MSNFLFAEMNNTSTKIEGPIKVPNKGIDIFSVSSPYTGGNNKIEVLLPEKIQEKIKYPVLYILSVGGDFGGKYGDQIMEIKKSGLHNTYNLICVSMAFDTVPWYGSHATNKQIQHDLYIKTVVIPLIEKFYPASNEAKDRILIGFSKSGWGAISLLLRNQDIFGFACSWDAPLMMDENNLKWGSAKHFGSKEHATAYVPINLVKKYAPELSKQKAKMAILGSSLYGKDTKAFHNLLDELKVPHIYSNDLKFEHHWESGWLPKALELLMTFRLNSK
ncbi:MAG TPA: alpha/beta hydrolase-fold protein [Victivallales bacterium]|nr:alpha/beta hydrolase-fold protein [Victivallales bacterium]